MPEYSHGIRRFSGGAPPWYSKIFPLRKSRPGSLRANSKRSFCSASRQMDGMRYHRNGWPNRCSRRSSAISGFGEANCPSPPMSRISGSFSKRRQTLFFIDNTGRRRELDPVRRHPAGIRPDGPEEAFPAAPSEDFPGMLTNSANGTFRLCFSRKKEGNSFDFSVPDDILPLLIEVLRSLSSVG